MGKPRGIVSGIGAKRGEVLRKNSYGGKEGKLKYQGRRVGDLGNRQQLVPEPA